MLLNLIFLFFLGSIFGYAIELFYRRFKHKKWVNPGFLIGPYLPIYGFGLCMLTIIFIVFSKFNINPIFIILLMGVLMTFIELIGGLIFINAGGVKLWDYSKEKFNYKGIICLKFSIIWTFLGGIYYYFIAERVLNALNWFNNNLSFSFILGLFIGVIIIDYIYSTNTLVKIRRFAKDNNLTIKYEELKKHIKDIQDRNREKYSFLFPFRQTKSLLDYLKLYKKNNYINNRKITFRLFKKNK